MLWWQNQTTPPRPDVVNAPAAPRQAVGPTDADRARHTAAVRRATEAIQASAKARARPPLVATTIRSARDAEESACRWLTHLGFRGCELTPQGADGGVDVRGPGVVAQVKAQAKPVGIAVVQRTYGCAGHRRAVVFGMAGFTPKAVEWADANGVALFVFDFTGAVKAVNGVARGLSGR